MRIQEETILSMVYTLELLSYRGMTVRGTVHQSLVWLKKWYKQQGDPEYLELALLQISALCRMGLAQEEDRALYNELCILAGTDMEKLMESCGGMAKQVKVSRPSIRSLIGKWMPNKKNSMTKSEVVEDIIDKLENQREGQYYYNYEKSWPKNRQSEEEKRDLYKLVINQEESFLLVLRQYLVYTPMYIERIRHITETCMRQLEMRYEIHAYETGQSVLDDLRKEIYYDVYLLDVQLPDMNGLEVAKQIRHRWSDPIVIYITNYVKYAVDAYELNTYRYIPKESLEEKLPKAYASMGDILRKQEKRRRTYVVERYAQKETILYRDIYYLKKDRKYVILVHKDGETSVRKTMSEIIEELGENEFLLIDRSYAVNIEHVQSVKNCQVYLQNGEVLPVSKPRWPHVRDTLMGIRR